MSSPALSNVLLPGTAKAGPFAQGRAADPWPGWDGSQHRACACSHELLITRGLL